MSMIRLNVVVAALSAVSLSQAAWADEPLGNAKAPELIFTRTKGWEVSLAGCYSVAVYDTVHLGLCGQYLFAERARQVQGYAERPIILPRSTAGGIE